MQLRGMGRKIQNGTKIKMRKSNQLQMKNKTTVKKGKRNTSINNILTQYFDYVPLG